LRRKLPKNNFKKKSPHHNYFDIIIDESGGVYIEPWDELWDSIFKKGAGTGKKRNVKIYKYCG
jgi:hypothetical protein